MKGFSDRFEDFPDYILKITEEIWEGRQFASPHHCYAPDIIMRSTSGIVRGNEGVIDDTMATLAECPDRQLYGEDVIWCGDAEAGFLSSHRIISTGTQTGYGGFGAPTGKSFVIRAIADCAAKDGVIHDEWLTRDESGLALQLGLDPAELARQRIAEEGGPARATRPFRPEDDIAGPYTGTGNDDEWGHRLADILRQIMQKDISVVRRAYDRAAHIAHPGRRDGLSWRFAETEWMRLRSAFPSARFTVDHRIGLADPGQPYRAAVRWSLNGRHDGLGAFGSPTGAPVHVMGFTHAEFGPRGLNREYTLFDEVAIWKQIHLHTGAAEPSDAG